MPLPCEGEPTVEIEPTTHWPLYDDRHQLPRLFTRLDPLPNWERLWGEGVRFSRHRRSKIKRQYLRHTFLTYRVSSSRSACQYLDDGINSSFTSNGRTDALHSSLHPHSVGWPSAIGTLHSWVSSPVRDPERTERYGWVFNQCSCAFCMNRIQNYIWITRGRYLSS